MKLKWVTCMLLVLVAVAVRLPAQKSDAGYKLFEETKAKAEMGNASAQHILGLCYRDGHGFIQNYTEAVKWFRKAAAQNLADAQLDLGCCYQEGQGVTQDYVEAVKWFRKASDQGYPEGEYNLGVMYENGYGVERDILAAIILYRKAAEKGFAIAQCDLGICYDRGNGIEKDPVEAVKWYRKAADQRCALGEYNLAASYENGVGVEKNAVKALNWYLKAAEQGHSPAQCNLGGMYYKGQGVPQDYVQVLNWWHRAAGQGDSRAQCKLGTLFEQGKGVTQDYIEAYKWYNLSAAGGDTKSSEFRSYIANRMTPDQIAEAQRRSAEFVPRKEKPDSTSSNPVSSTTPKATGTGFFITDDGYLISNYHVVKGAVKVRLQTSAGLIDAAVVKVDAANDLALLKASGVFKPLPVAASRTVKLGATVATVGFPDTGLQGFSPKLAKGEIASLAGAADDPRYFQISVPVQPGNSGGSLVEAHGNVVGIVAAKLSARAALDATGSLPENVNYAVKSSLLLSFLESVPDVASKLKEPNTKEESFEDVVKSAQAAAVLVLVY